MPDPLRFDVAISTFGALAHVQRCLTSLYRTISLPETAFTVFIWDDPTSDGDGTRAWLREFCPQHPSIRVTYGEKHVGGSGWNMIREPILAAENPILLTIHSDIEFLCPGWHEEVIRRFEADPRLALCAPCCRSPYNFSKAPHFPIEIEYAPAVNQTHKSIFVPRYQDTFCFVRKAYMKEFDLDWDPVRFESLHPKWAKYRVVFEHGAMLTLALGRNGWKGLSLPWTIYQRIWHAGHGTRPVHEHLAAQKQAQQTGASR